MPVPLGAGIKRTATEPHLPVTCDEGNSVINIRIFQTWILSIIFSWYNQTIQAIIDDLWWKPRKN